jgi:acyl dehydratase
VSGAAIAPVGRYFEDFALGERFTTSGVTLTESMIVEFALTYDPQPFHIDVGAARGSIYGGLICSGFQSLALGFRMLWDTGLFRGTGLGSPGIDELHWVKPVRPALILEARSRLAAHRLSRR